MPVINKTYNVNITSGQLSDYFVTATFVQNETVIPLSVVQNISNIIITSNGDNIGKVGNYNINITFNSLNYCP